MSDREQTMKGKPSDSGRAFTRLKEEIEAQAQQKADKKIEEAEKKAAEIIANAKKEAKSVKSKIISEAKDETQKQKVREVSRKKLAIKMDYLETRESIIRDIQVEARSELQNFTKIDDYASFLSELVKGTGISIGGGDLILTLRKEDKGHFTKDSLAAITKEIEKVSGVSSSISVEDTDLKALGGIKMRRSDGNIFVNNTFENRLERREEDIRAALLEVLE